ncbi:MAG: hypothetical protein Q9216_003435 [Gyalolechia sp. 2 TL-2023]
MSTSTTPSTSSTDPPPATEGPLPPSAPLAPTSPSTKYSPPFRPIFLSLLVVTPILAFLPPRKLDLFTFMLGLTFVISAEELAFGSASQRPAARTQLQPFAASPQDAKGSVPLAAQSEAAERYKTSPTAPHDVKANLIRREKEETGVAGLARKLWYGSETEDWKERRAQEERKALEEGRGYWGLMSDAVRDVFGGAVQREDVERFNEERKRARQTDGKG